MTQAKRKLHIPWPFAPTQVRLNSDTGLLKLVAMAAMLCDHMGKMLFPQYRVLRLIGRLAMPIFAYCIASGCVYTRNPLKYLGRIVLLALITQPIYAISMGHSSNAMFSYSFVDRPIQAVFSFYMHSWDKHPSILLPFALCVLLIWSLRERKLVFTIAVAVLCWHLRGKLDYGLWLVGLVLLFYIFISRRWLSLPIVLAYMLLWALQGGGYSLFGVRFGMQMFAIFALPLIYIHTNSGIRLPKWLFYAFYPAHFALIYVLNTFGG